MQMDGKTKMMLYSYNPGSKSAKLLAEELGCQIIKHKNSEFKGNRNKVVMNWGAGEVPPEVRKCKIINQPDAICRAVSKLRSFHDFTEAKVKCVPWTTSYDEARQWIKAGGRVVCRTRIEGKDGEGIVMASNLKELRRAGLYTLFIPNTTEYRITVFNGEVICRQKKVRIPGLEKYNDEIRTSSGNYGFDLVDLVPNVGIIPQARKAVEALGLSMGGVDIIADADECWVLEVNTAPHLTPVAARRLAHAIKGFVRE